VRNLIFGMLLGTALFIFGNLVASKLACAQDTPNTALPQVQQLGDFMRAFTLHDCIGEPHWLIAAYTNGLRIIHVTQVKNKKLLDSPIIIRVPTPREACQ